MVAIAIDRASLSHQTRIGSGDRGIILQENVIQPKRSGQTIDRASLASGMAPQDTRNQMHGPPIISNRSSRDRPPNQGHIGERQGHISRDSEHARRKGSANGHAAGSAVECDIVCNVNGIRQVDSLAAKPHYTSTGYSLAQLVITANHHRVDPRAIHS